jgi:transposase InsO family protein
LGRPTFSGTTITDPAAPATADLVGRDFTAAAPGTRLVGDITYIPTWQGWLYLATVIDCYSKKVIGWALADDLKTSLVVRAMTMAFTAGGIAAGCIFHTEGCAGGCPPSRSTAPRRRCRRSPGAGRVPSSFQVTSQIPADSA